MTSASISVVKGKGSMNHNNRVFVTENVDESRTKDNITYKRESLESAYEECFGKAIKEYNQKQKRADRRIDGARGYMEQIKTSKNGEKLFYENVIQVGNMFDSHVGTEQGKTVEKVLDDYMKSFEKRNPNLYVFNAVLHLDEQTPHLHIDYIPIAHGYKQGLQVRNSLDRAYKEQGIEGKSNKFENRTIAWQNAEKDHIEIIMLTYGLERTEDKGLHQEHLSVEQYKAIAERVNAEVKEIPPQIEKTPTILHKERVTVNASDLERLEDRAKLSMVHEKATKQLVSEVKKELEQATSYKENNKGLLEQAQRELHRAKEEHSKAVRMAKTQEELNERYRTLANAYMKQQKTIEELTKENTSLKAQIDDLRQSVEQRIESAIKPLKEQIGALQSKLEDMAKGQVTLMRAVRYVRDHFSGEVGREVLNATLGAGNRFLKEDGFEEYSKDREATLSKSVGANIELDLTYRKGDEGKGLYASNGVCLINVNSIKEARELLPNCKIKNEQDRGLTR